MDGPAIRDGYREDQSRERDERDGLACFPCLEKRAPRRVAGPSAELGGGGSVLRLYFVQGELIAGSPREDHQREQQEGETAQGAGPFLLSC
jgi:hypothetical protein